MPDSTRRLPPGARKLVLAVHIVASVSWIGVDAVLLVLGATALGTSDPTVADAAYPIMARLGDWLVTPLSLTALASGVLLGVGTRWGLLRHYWVLASLLATAAMTAAAIVLLNPLLHEVAAAPVAPATGGERIQVVAASSVALVLLSAVNALNVYKPRGRTPWYSRSSGTHAGVAGKPRVNR